CQATCEIYLGKVAVPFENAKTRAEMIYRSVKPMYKTVNMRSALFRLKSIHIAHGNCGLCISVLESKINIRAVAERLAVTLQRYRPIYLDRGVKRNKIPVEMAYIRCCSIGVVKLNF